MLKRIIICFLFCFAFFLSSCEQFGNNQKATYSVTFNYVLDENKTTITVDKGDTVKEVIPISYDGFSFIGWTLDLENKDLFDFNTAITCDITLYALWVANTNQIVFNGNGSTSGQMDALTAKTDEIITLPNNIYEKEGYSFVGWSLTSNGEVIFADNAEYKVTIDPVVTLYAVWTVNTNQIVFDGNGSTTGQMDNVTAKTDEIITLPNNEYEKEGYTFVGWSLTSNGEVEYTDKSEYKVSSESIITLYAIWTANTNQVAFDGNGSTSGQMGIVNAKTDEIITLPNNLYKKEGYTFVGWSVVPDGEVLFENRSTYKVSSNSIITLYAIWQPNTNTIHFDSNGATSGAMDSIKCKTDEVIILPKNNFEKENYIFGGWALTSDGEVLYEDASNYKASSKANVILYAIWEEEIIDYSYIIDEYIPDVINRSIEMPNRYDDLRLIWSTSNQYTLNNYGNLIKPRNDENLTVYLTVYDDGKLFEYEKEVTVEAIEFAPLPSSNLVFGYYSQWNFFGYTEKMLETCDVVNLCFGYVTADFKINTASILAVINQVLSIREKGVRVVLSIQGYSTEGTNFSRAAATEEGRITLAESMLRVVEKFHLDGIDIDWEYPGFNTGTSVSVDKVNYTLLCKQIKETFKKANEDYLITAAIPGGGNGPYRFDLGNVAKHLDFIHIMTYDLQNSSLATHHTALYDSSATLSGCSVASSVQTYKNNGVPSNKIVIGLAFYGKRTSATSLNGRASGGYKSLNYDVIAKDYLSRLNKDVIYGFDETAYAPYLIDKTNGYFITYDDERSISGKCQYAIDNNLGGVMIWEIGQDTSDLLLSAVYDTLKK